MSVEALMEPAAMRRLAELAAAVPADLAIVEVGTYQAANLVSMALAAKAGQGAKVHGVDPYGTGDVYRGRRHMLARYTHADLDIARDHIKANRCSRQARIHVGTSTAVAAEWTGPQVDLLVIDGEHRYRSVMADWAAWSPHLAEDAIVAFDDYGGRVGEQVIRAVTDLEERGALTVVEHVGTRMAITMRS